MQEGKTMEAAPEEGSAGSGAGAGAGKEEDLEKEIWRCLNSVHHLLTRREILNQTLRKGWMELVSARYEMGAARISHPLFSLKPQAGKAVVDVSLSVAGGDIGAVLGDDDNGEELSMKGPLFFELTRDSSERKQDADADADAKKKNVSKKRPLSELRRRPASILADDDRDELLKYNNLLDDSDFEDDLKPLEVQKNSLQGFGTLVSPQLRHAQGTFFKALQLAMELLNAQSAAMDAHRKVSNLQSSTAHSMSQ